MYIYITMCMSLSHPDSYSYIQRAYTVELDSTVLTSSHLKSDIYMLSK